MSSIFHTSWSTILSEKENNRERKHKAKVFQDAWNSVNEERWKSNLKIRHDRKAMTKRVDEYLTQQTEMTIQSRTIKEVNDTYSSLDQFDYKLTKSLPVSFGDTTGTKQQSVSDWPNQKLSNQVQQSSNSKRRKYIRDIENHIHKSYQSQLDNQISSKVLLHSSYENTELNEVDDILKAISRLTSHRESRNELITKLKKDNQNQMKALLNELIYRYNHNLLQVELNAYKTSLQSFQTYDRDVDRSIAKSVINNILDDVINSTIWISEWRTFSILHNKDLDHTQHILNDEYYYLSTSSLFHDTSNILQINTNNTSTNTVSSLNKLASPLTLVIDAAGDIVNTSITQVVNINDIKNANNTSNAAESTENTALKLASRAFTSEETREFLLLLAKKDATDYFSQLNLPVYTDTAVVNNDDGTHESITMNEDAATTTVVSVDKNEHTSISSSVSNDKFNLSHPDWILQCNIPNVIGETLLRTSYFSKNALSESMNTTTNPTTNSSEISNNTVIAPLVTAHSLNSDKNQLKNGFYEYPCRMILSCVNLQLKKQFAEFLHVQLPELVLISVEELVMKAIEKGQQLMELESEEPTTTAMTAVATIDELMTVEVGNDTDKIFPSDQESTTVVEEVAISNESNIILPSSAAAATAESNTTEEDLTEIYNNIAKQAYFLISEGSPITDEIYTSLIVNKIKELSKTTFTQEQALLSTSEQTNEEINAVSTGPKDDTIETNNNNNEDMKNIYGWILVDYPNTRSQSHYLMKALSGGIDYDDMNRLPQISDHKSKFHQPLMRENVYPDVSSCGISSFVYINTNTNNNANSEYEISTTLYHDINDPSCATAKADISHNLSRCYSHNLTNKSSQTRRNSKLAHSEQWGTIPSGDATDIAKNSKFINYPFQNPSVLSTGSTLQGNKVIPAQSLDIFIRNKEISYMKEFYTYLNICHEYSINSTSTNDDNTSSLSFEPIARSIFKFHKENLMSFQSKNKMMINTSHRDFNLLFYSSEELETLDSDRRDLFPIVEVHNESHVDNITAGMDMIKLETDAISSKIPPSKATAAAPLTTSASKRTNAPSSSTLPATTQAPPPSIFLLHSILMELIQTSETRSFDQATNMFYLLRMSYYHYYHKRHLIYHSLINILNQEDHRLILLNTYMDSFNHVENDIYRFEPLFQEEMLLRNYELITQLQTIAALRKNDGLKYIKQICTDNTINNILTSLYIAAVSFLQSEYSRFIMNFNVLFDYTKTMTDVSAALDSAMTSTTTISGGAENGISSNPAAPSIAAAVASSARGINQASARSLTQASARGGRQILEDTLNDFDVVVGDGKKSVAKSKPPATSSGGKTNKDGTPIFTPYRSPLPIGDECIPQSDEWKPFLPDIAIITALNSCTQYMNSMTASNTTTSGVAADKKTKTTEKPADKTKKGATTSTAATTVNPYAVNYNNVTLQEMFKNLIKKIEAIVTSNWSQGNFVLSRVLYNNNEALCQLIENTVWVSFNHILLIYLFLFIF